MEKGEVRIAKITANPFNDEGEMKNYHHPVCIFETFAKARSTTKVIEVSVIKSFPYNLLELSSLSCFFLSDC